MPETEVAQKMPVVVTYRPELVTVHFSQCANCVGAGAFVNAVTGTSVKNQQCRIYCWILERYMTALQANECNSHKAISMR